MSLRFDAILFDLDGTLADTALEITRAIGLALNDLDLHSAVSIHSLVDGSPLEEVFAVAAPNASPKLLVRFIERYRAHYDTQSNEHTHVFPGVIDTLDALRVLIPRPRLAVATAKRSITARQVCTTLGIAHYFDLIEGTGATNTPPKPAPDLLLSIAARLKVSPSRTLMVGDTVRDISAGKSARMLTAAVHWGLGGYDNLLRSEPDFWLEEPEDLLAIIAAC